MIYHAMIEVDLEADDMDGADRQGRALAQRICDESLTDCARIKSLTEHLECARLGCDRRVAYWGAAYCGAACSAQRNDPICTCPSSLSSLVPALGCPVHGA